MVQNNVTFLIIITCLIGNIYIDVFLNAIHITIFNVYSTSVTGYTLASSFILHPFLSTMSDDKERVVNGW